MTLLAAGLIALTVLGQVASSQHATPGRISRAIGSGEVRLPKLLKAPEPVMPPAVRAARIRGTVRMEAEIDKDGRVAALRVLSGPALLMSAAMEAAKYYEYTPGTLRGVPIWISTTIEVKFHADFAPVEPMTVN